MSNYVELEELRLGRLAPKSGASRSIVAKGLGLGYVSVTAATASLSGSQSFSVVALDRAAGSTVTLPALSNSVDCPIFVVYVKTNCTSNSYIINTASGSDTFIGGVNELETDTGDDGPSSTGSGVTLTLGNATDQVGDIYIIIGTPGRKWLVLGQSALDGGAAFS